ncbi:YqjF family protein [Pedobacter antarcticus]|uniref:YqjF family protein n=1 Tax=Pedobacter antarcticus TaxID=34086 RepID=UPI001C582D0C|nr:DUF2071 domain-containing protein [Pedobacter antarcticus]
MSFLTAEWRKVAIANFTIDKNILTPYLPAGTELDLHNDTCYVSLIGFLFKNTRLLGFSVPFHASFEQANLRFYVKRKDGDQVKSGVVFIREIVPRFALSVVANTIYNENYVSMPMNHRWAEEEEEREVEYRWRVKKEWQSFSIKANKALSEIQADTEAAFITQHYWCYARYSDTKTNEYEVRHPKWAQYKVKDFSINVDFGISFGKEFAFLNGKEPVSVYLAEGSDISVERKNVIEVK